MKKISLRTATLVVIIFAAAFSRIIPHIPNFSPMEAIILFAAAHFVRKWQAFAIPFAAMWLSSLFIDNVIYAAYQQSFVWMYPGFHWQYLSYGIIAIFGIFIFRKGTSALKIAGGGLVAAAIFFAVSNFGVWAEGTLYPRTGAGLVACYTAAIPFFRGTLAGVAVYVPLLFGSYALIARALDFHSYTSTRAKAG